MKLNQDINLSNQFNLINLNYLLSTPILPAYPPNHCAPLLNSENELTSALQCASSSNSKMMLQLNQQAKSDVVEALTNVLSMNHNNSNIALATANALRLNNGLDTYSKQTTSSATAATLKQQTNGSLNNQNNETEMKKLILKKSSNERKYPCGYPGCHWIFTRSNHVVRHQRRIHGLKVDKLEHNKVRQPRINNNIPAASNLMALSRNQLNQNPNLLLMNRKLNNLSADYSRLKRTSLSKNSLLSSMCNSSNESGITNSRQAYKLAPRSQSHQPIKIGNIRRFQCNVNNCGQKFSNELLFNNHLKLLHNVDRSLINKNLHLNQQNTSLNNLNSIKNLHNNSSQNSLTNLMANQEVNNNSPKMVKNNLNAINNHIKLFLSNKPNSNDSDSLTSYLNNLNSKLKQFQQPKLHGNAACSNLVNNIGQQQLITKVQQVNQSGPTISLQPKMFLPVTTINNLNNLNVDQQAKPFLITQIQIPQNNQILANQLIANNNCNNSNQAHLQQQIISPQQSKFVIFKCEIKNCLKCFTSKDNLVDHLFDDHRVFEPEIIVNLENDSENWLLMDDPKDTNIGLPLPKSQPSSKQEILPCKMGRTAKEPSLASTLGIIKDVVSKVENVNLVHNIAANSSTTYSGLSKQHVCNISDCRKSFTKRYHLVKHRLTAHNIGKLSLMEDILNANNQKQQQKTDQEIEESNETSLLDKSEIRQENATSISCESKIEHSSLTSKVNQNNTNQVVMPAPFYVRRPPQDIRPYPCLYPKCNWSFKRAYHLKRHIRTHRHYYENCPEEPPKDFPLVKPVDLEEAEDDVIELSSSTSSGHSLKVDEAHKSNAEIENDETCSIVDNEEQIESKQKEDMIKQDKEFEHGEQIIHKEIEMKPIRKRTRSVEQQLLMKEEEIVTQKEDFKQTKQITGRNVVKQQIKSEPIIPIASTTTTDEENSSFSSDLSNHTNQQTIQCEFSDCGKKFKRQRQYDLHIKTHLSEKPAKKAKIEMNETTILKSELDDNSSEEKCSILANNMRAGRTRSRTNDLNNNMSLDLDKLIDDQPQQQLVLLCNSKDVIFLNNVEVKKKEKNTFVCDVNNCGKRFGRNCELTRHKLNHIDFWPYVCEYSNCGKKFKRKDVYKNHQRTHEKNGDKIDA